MLHPVTFRTLAVLACGCLLAWDAAALSLGRARGAVLIGRPLELAIPVALDAGDDSPCASAELFHGDSKVGRAPEVRWEPGAEGQGVLRVTSMVPVDEPMVTLYLRAGCKQSTTRRYVMLAEPPPEVEPAAPVLRGPAAQAPQAVPARPAQAPRAAAPRSAAGPGAAAPGAVSPPAAASRAAPPARAVPRARKEAVQAQPRLKLEPLDLSIDRDPTLRLSSELRSQVAADPQQRAAAAALWQALQKGPEQAYQDGLGLQNAERELRSLQESARQDAGALAQLRAQVEQSRRSRDTASLLVVVLSTLLAGLLAWLAWRWYRTAQIARVGRWFETHGESVQGKLQSTAPMPVPPAKPAAVAGKAAAVPAPPKAVRSAPMPMPPVPGPARATTGRDTLPPLSWGGSEEYQTSRGGSIRMVGVEELIDVHDKADFFLSIGQPEQAVAVLEAHVHDQVETGALAWMDLLELYHRLGKREEYERLRAEFRQHFTGQVPDYEHFDQPSASLENYSRALSRIVALWPSRKVLDVIEESIFRKPGLPGAEPFSLEAYRELVLLYHIAKDLAPEPEPAEPASGPSSLFSDTALQPLNMLEPRELTEDDRERLLIPPSSARIGVDIELDHDDTAPSELSPLDFDISEFRDTDGGDAQRKPN